jgi:hypothetical protein
MSRARFSADAEADLLAIVEFIAQDNPTPHLRPDTAFLMASPSR